MSELNKESLVLEKISELEQPLLSEHSRLFPNWKVCGTVAIALSRILSVQTSIPVGRGLSGEHLEVDVGLYDPVNSPSRLKDFTEHAYIKYDLGDGTVYFIDPTTQLRLNPKRSIRGAIRVEKYNKDSWRIH
jgi:hypothetical protein